jgi:hypothetical protein
VDDISKNLQEGQQTDILILDFAKAFDKINHSLLIHKLQHYGIIGKSVRWIQNWLANRKQSVAFHRSGPFEIHVVADTGYYFLLHVS